MKTAIVIGATGLTGGLVLRQLLKDHRYTKVKVFTRRPTGHSHPKLREYVVDLLNLEEHREQFTADEVFCCIGSTKAKTPDLEMYRKIDFGVPVTAARLAKENGIKKILIVSALGSKPDSKFWYNRTKGEMEREVMKVGVKETYFFQPALIAGDREEQRSFEDLGKFFMKLADPLLVGSFQKYRSIKPEVIANAMIYVANQGHDKIGIRSDEIKTIARKAEFAS